MAWTNNSSSSSAGAGGAIKFSQGAVLTPAASTITPTDPFHHVAAGTIATIATTNFDTSTGNLLWLVADGAITINFTGNITGSTTSLSTNDAISYLLDGTTWREQTRLTNVTVKDANFTIQDDVDSTKKVQFQASGITTATTRTITVPDANTTLPIATQVITFAGLTAARTITFTDNAQTVAQVGLDNAFTAAQTISAAGGLTLSNAAGGVTERNRAAAMGIWTTPTYAAGNFTGNGSMTWTVEAGDVTTYEYMMVGKTMTLAWYLTTTTVGGTPNNILQVAIPGGFTASKQIAIPMLYNDAGAGNTAGYALLSAGGAVVQLLKLNNGNWSASTNATQVNGTITFEVS